MRLSNLSFKFFKFFFVINTFLFISLVFSYAILNIPFIPKLLGLKDFFLVLCRNDILNDEKYKNPYLKK
jgi:hypothetical protein